MNRKDVMFRPCVDVDGNRWECFVQDGAFSYAGYGKTQEEAWRAADSPDLNDADCLTGCAGVITGPTSRAYLGSCFDEGKFTRTDSKWLGGVVVTELGDGGAYFAPPGDFSKVDFSACRELGESVNLDATLNRMGFTPFDAGRYAKPSLPSLMTEAGEKYQGLGWCDE